VNDSSPGYQRFFAEMKRRRVFRVMAVYGVVAFAIIQVADAIFPRLALPDWTITLVVWLALLGFPVAVVLAWALDLTPEGIRRTDAAAPGEIAEIIAAPASKRWPSGLLALVGVGALVIGAWYVGRQSAPLVGGEPSVDSGNLSLAVLPFADMSPDGDQEYFGDGVAEELLNLLAQIPALRVSARTSSFSFKGQNLEIPEIARRLNVAHVLEGSVRKAGNLVRVNAQLVRAEDGFHVWSDTWDRTLDDIFAIQHEIAAAVVQELRVTLLSEAPTVQETDAAAYALYLQARHHYGLGSTESRERAVELYREALAIDSAYAPAWAGLARVYASQAYLARSGQPFDFGPAQEAANRAIALDSALAHAHSALARTVLYRDGDLQLAAEHFRRAVSLSPTDPAVLFDLVLPLALGRLSEDIALLEFLALRDPVNPAVHAGLGEDYRWAGRLDESISSNRTALDLSPTREHSHFEIAAALMLKGQPERALAELEQEPGEVWRLIGQALTYHAVERSADADSVLGELTARYGTTWAYKIAYVHAWRGEADRAFEWLDKAVQADDPRLNFILVESFFANIHDDPRWVPFLERIGRSPEQVAAIDFEIQLPQ
jgi:TolB-like protein/thioredoxin-like negative regulator of GroEL